MGNNQFSQLSNLDFEGEEKIVFSEEKRFSRLDELESKEIEIELEKEKVNESIKLPSLYQNTEKDLQNLVQSVYGIEQEDLYSLQLKVDLHTDLESIEKSVFGDLKNEKYFCLKFFVRSFFF